MNYKWLTALTTLVIASGLAIMFAITGMFTVVFATYIVLPGYYDFFGTIMLASAGIIIWDITRRLPMKT